MNTNSRVLPLTPHYANLFISFCMAVSAPLFSVAQSKQPVSSEKDLPLRTFAVTDSLPVVFKDTAAMDLLRGQLKTRLLADLRVYHFTDTSMLKTWYRDIADLYFYEGDSASAAYYYYQLQSFETKPSLAATTALVKRSQLLAGDPASPAYPDRFREIFSRNIAALPKGTGNAPLERIRGQYNVTAAEVIERAKGELNPRLASGLLRHGDLMYLLFLHYEMPGFNKQAALVSQVLDSVLAQTATADIWPERSVVLEPGKNYKPVTICVFDLGVDVKLFPGRLYSNALEKRDGMDNDKNGFIDDLNGVAFDIHENRDTSLLGTLPSRVLDNLPFYYKMRTGSRDLRAGQNSMEAIELRDTVSKMTDVLRQQLRTDIELLSDYAHGTHVAGIAMEGNPYARLLTVRFTADIGFRREGGPRTGELEERVAANLLSLVKYWKKNNVRVVNMSWGLFLSDYEADVKEFNPGLTEDQAKALALRLWNKRKESLYRAFSLAPEILFIASNGNKGTDAATDLRYPAQLALPNMIAVGSVDAAGNETAFTATGKTVMVHANGYEVESLAPGGAKIRMSGTSMATPYIANLAAKLFVLDPQLTAVQVKQLILDGADASGDGRVKLANPKKSVALVSSATKPRSTTKQ